MMMKRLLMLCVILLSVINFVSAQDRHELKNMHVKVQSHEFNKSRKIEKRKKGTRDYIYGDLSAYAFSKSKPMSKLTAPSAEYLLQTGLAGGSFEVTIAYRAEKNDKYNVDPEIEIGFDEFASKNIKLDYTKLVKRKSVTFKVSLLKGKKHKLKLWFTTPNVEVDYVEIRRKLINK